MPAMREVETIWPAISAQLSHNDGFHDGQSPTVSKGKTHDTHFPAVEGPVRELA